MAGTVTITEARSLDWPVQKVTFDWLSDGSGNADAVTTYAYTGKVVRYVEIPDSGGTQPTTLYDVVVNDDDGVDILAGVGANIANTGPAQTVATESLGAVTESKLSLVVAAAGAAKGGKTIVYIQRGR